MKKLLLLVSVVAAVLCCTMTSCEPAKAEGGTSSLPMQQTQQQQPQQTVAKGVVGFNSADFQSKVGMTRDEFISLAQMMPFGEPVQLHDQEVTKITSIIEINGIESSNSKTQSLVEYEYKNPKGDKATNRILIQGGNFQDDVTINGLPLKFNEQRVCCSGKCTILFGGCIKQIPCKAPRKANKCQSKPSNCGPCQQGSVIQEGGDSSMSANQPNASRAVPQRRRR